MTTTVTTAVTGTAAGPILAIDLGKYKSVACTYRSAAEYAFQSVPTSRDDLARLVARARPAVVVVEACTPAEWVHELCQELGVRCAVTNTASDQWKYRDGVPWRADPVPGPAAAGGPGGAWPLAAEESDGPVGGLRKTRPRSVD